MKNRIYFTYYEIIKQNVRILPTIKNVVGVFFAWGNNFHPYCTYFRIYTHPFYAELHIEEFLLNEIQKRENFKLPLQTSIWETSAHLKDYYEQNNFMEIRRTYMPILDVQKSYLSKQRFIQIIVYKPYPPSCPIITSLKN